MATRKPKGLIRPRHWTLEQCLEAYSIPEPNSGCILWMKSTASGYGILRWDGRLQRAHRLSWQAKHGVVPSAALSVCHRCDVPACINPDHLFLGDAEANARDKMDKGRHTPVRGSKQPNAKLRECDVIAIRNDTRPKHEIAAEYGVSEGAIYGVQKRKKWAFVP